MVAIGAIHDISWEIRWWCKMKLSEIRARVRIHIDEPNEESWADAQLNALIADATEEVASLFLALDDSYYVTDGTFDIKAKIETYDLPEGFLRIKELRDNKKNPIFRLYKIGQRSDFLGYGYTERYYFQKGKIGFLDIPSVDAIYPCKFVKVATALDITDENAVPDVPKYLGHTLIAVEASLMALDMDEETSTYLISKSRNLKRQIVDLYSQRNTDFACTVEDDSDLDLD